MKLINKVMVAMDLSALADYARKFAAEVAHKAEAELYVVNVINQVETYAIQKMSKNRYTVQRIYRKGQHLIRQHEH